jgi:hypothetical protein
MFVCISCANNTRTQIDKDVEISKVDAERAYIGIAAAYHAGRISEGTMAQVDTCYERWRSAYQRYVDASNAGVMNLAPQHAEVQAALLALLKMESFVTFRELSPRP